jgi:nitrite reductase/ring-hydroxylating ferredoxin subunit
MSECPTHDAAHDVAHDACTDSCDEPSGRRAFLKEGLMAVAALTALGATAGRLEALTRSYAEGSRRGNVIRYPMPTADGATIDKANKVIVARFDGTVHAFALECPHRGENVEWQGDRGRFYCPKHKSTFQPEGSLIQGKAERGLDRHAISRDNGEVVVDTAVTIRSTNAAAWSAAKIEV